MQVVDLFPIPFAISKLTFDETEFNFAIKYASSPDNLYKNINKNYSSQDTLILDKMPILKSKIETYLKNYMYEFLGETANLKITQSWLNCNLPGTSHHKHKHANSIVSGVVYLQTDKDSGNFNVYKHESGLRPILDTITNWQKYNYEYVYFPPTVGNIFLFPSALTHSVEENKSTISRISLSFNTFYDGNFGSDKNLTKVTLK